MAPRDWSTDCRTLFNNHPCKILSTAGIALCTALLWYADRIETQMDAMQAALVSIQLDVAAIRGAQNLNPARPPVPGGGIAMVEAE